MMKVYPCRCAFSNSIKIEKIYIVTVLNNMEIKVF